MKAGAEILYDLLIKEETGILPQSVQISIFQMETDTLNPFALPRAGIICIAMNEKCLRDSRFSTS